MFSFQVLYTTLWQIQMLHFDTNPILIGYLYLGTVNAVNNIGTLSLPISQKYKLQHLTPSS